jgi:hypothetical protein
MRVVIAAAIIGLLIQPAYSQTKFEAEDLRAERQRKELELQHKATMERIPNQKKKNSDPWNDVRGTEPPKKKTN